MSELIKSARTNWDRLLKYACFIAFGVSSLFDPTPSTRSMPAVFLMMFNIELILAGVLLVISLFHPSMWWRYIGHTIIGVALVTLAALILLQNQSPLWILLMGLAIQGVISVRDTKRYRQVSHHLAIMAQGLSERQQGGGGG